MKIAIIGAGLAGLATGYWLQKKGHDVTLYEASHRSAGRAQTILRPGTDDILDVGTQYFHSNYRRALGLVDELGLSPSLYKIRGKTRFFDDRVMDGSFVTGHRLPFIKAGSLGQNLAMSLSGLMRMARYPIDPYGLGATFGIDDVSIGERISDPFFREFNGRTLVSAGALVEPDYGKISYLHLIRLMRIIVMTDYLVLAGGIASLHEALAKTLNIEFETPVFRLLMEREKVCGVCLSDARKIKADHVILATPPKAAAKILPKNWQEEQFYLNSVEQPPALIATFFLDRMLEDGIWSYVFRPAKDRLVSFCLDTAQKNPQGTRSGKTALQAWVCSPAAERLIGLSDADIYEALMLDLAQGFKGLPDFVEGVHIHRVAQAIPQMGLGHQSRAKAFLQAIDQRAGLDVAGDHLSGGYMECALWSAQRIVRHLHGLS